MTLRLTTLGLACAALLLNGCRDREIISYQAPKDPVATPPPAMAAQSSNAQLPEVHPPVGQQAEAAPGPGAMTGNVPTARDGALTWTAPAHWTAKPLGSMRKGSYAINGDNGAADLAITAFPGDTGGLFANVNRWRGQVGLSPIAEAELASAVEHLDLNGLHIELVTCVGNAGGQSSTLLGAIVPYQGETWFFKLLGPSAIVEKEKAAFREFLGTMKSR